MHLVTRLFLQQSKRLSLEQGRTQPSSPVLTPFTGATCTPKTFRNTQPGAGRQPSTQDPLWNGAQENSIALNTTATVVSSGGYTRDNKELIPLQTLNV